MHKLYTVATLVILASLALAACGGGTPEVTQAPPEEAPTSAPVEAAETEAPPPPTEAPAPESGTVVLRVGGLEDIDCWNPYSCSSHWPFNDLVYEGFTGHGKEPGCDGVPRLADSMEVSDDGLTWTIHLDEGITYSDGTPFDANSAVEFIDWFNSTSLVYWFYTTLYMQDVHAVDDLTLQFTTELPISTVEDYDGVWWWMLPPHIWTNYTEDTLWEYDAFPPVGTGPYTVTEHQPGEYIIYDAMPDYHRGEPPVDRIVYQIYANADAMINAFLAGEIDLTARDTPTIYYDTLVDAPHTTVEERAPGNLHHLAFNLYDGGNKNLLIEDPEVRKAIDYATNKQEIVDVALLGHGVTCPNVWACGPNYADEVNPNIEVTPFDLEQAAQILEDAGYQDRDGDGIREAQDGTPLSFRLFYKVEIPAHLTMADMVTDWLAEIGVEIVPEALESGTLQRVVYDDRDYDIALFSEGADIDPASIDFEFSCWTADAGSAGLNNAGFCSEEMDNLLFEYWTTRDEEAAQTALYAMDEMLATLRPRVNLAGENQIQAFNSEKFDFPRASCNVGMGMWDYPSVMEIEVK
jgi:peptide/nickel transport system substrate-binding protein